MVTWTKGTIMGIKEIRRRDYNPDAHGNIFDFVVEESERIRYWQGQETQDAIPARDQPSSWLSLTRHKPGRTATLLNPQVPRPDHASQNVFEISQARKL